MNKLLSRLKKVEKSIKNNLQVIRFIELVDGDLMITLSTLKSEIGLKINSLEEIKNINNGNSITFIENINE